MKKSFIWTCFVAFAAIIIVAIAYFYTPNKGSRTIATTGDCTALVEKDRTAITFRTRALNKSAGESLKTARHVADNLIGLAKSLNDSSMQIQTLRIDSYEKNEWNQEAKKSESLGIETNIAIEISSTDRRNIEYILTKMPDESNVFLENLKMFASVNKTKPAIETCMVDALKNAKHRAELLAAANNEELGKTVSIEYGAAISNGPHPLRMAIFSEKGTSMSATDDEIRVSVSAVFMLK